ncbi:MAG: hypothetical protein AB7E80_09450 [Hyphomicrobiaceae bacterium]
MGSIGKARRSIGLLAVLVAAVLAGACAGNQDEGGGQRVSSAGKGCQDIRREIDKLDSRGVPAKIEAQKAGQKMSASQKADIDQYNRLLADYLGNRCHM